MTNEKPFNALSITRPDPALLNYFLCVSLLTLVAFPLVFIPLWIKYATLKYKIDDEGVSMSWGYLYRKEIVLTYRKIQDIHVRRNILHRWLGLADVSIQTASGTSGSEMIIVGIRQPKELRDFLYTKMRGAHPESTEPAEPSSRQISASPTNEAISLLVEIRDEVRRMRHTREDES